MSDAAPARTSNGNHKFGEDTPSTELSCPSTSVVQPDDLRTEGRPVREQSCLLQQSAHNTRLDTPASQFHFPAVDSLGRRNLPGAGGRRKFRNRGVGVEKESRPTPPGPPILIYLGDLRTGIKADPFCLLKSRVRPTPDSIGGYGGSLVSDSNFLASTSRRQPP